MRDLTQVQAFVEVAERGTVAGAAEALSFTAPAVSQQLAKLERDLDGPLFDRKAGRLHLNARGSALLPLARQLLDLAEEAAESVAAAVENPHVVVAGFASALRALVVPLVTRKGRPYELEIREVEDEEALRGLGLGHVDVAIVQEYDGFALQRNDRFDFRVLLRDRLRLITPSRTSPSITIDDLRTSRWLVNGSGTRCEQAMSLILSRAGIQPEVAGHIGDNSTLLALVKAGHGATIVPELVLADAPRGITVAHQDLKTKRTIVAVTRRSQTKRHAILLNDLRPEKVAAG